MYSFNNFIPIKEKSSLRKRTVRRKKGKNYKKVKKTTSKTKGENFTFDNQISTTVCFIKKRKKSKNPKQHI